MSRGTISRPVALAFEDGVIDEATSVFDFGCGRGSDIRHLKHLGIDAAGWDPIYAPNAPLSPAAVVNIGYVINVIEDRMERRKALEDAWALAGEALVVAARPAWEQREVKGRPHADGIITGKDTFQKFYEQDELRSFVEATTGRQAVAAAPGVFYVFKSALREQAVLARRARREGGGQAARIADLLYAFHREQLRPLQEFVHRERRLPASGELGPAESSIAAELGSVRHAFSLIRRATGVANWSDVPLGRPSQTDRRYELHKELLGPLEAFVDERGRLPRPGELPDAVLIEEEFGSVRAAFSLIRRVTGPERWAIAEEYARRAFLVYLALAAFGGRSRYSDLPVDLQFDVRDLFGTYTAAVKEADRLLFSAGDIGAIGEAVRTASVGKVTPEALYVHVSAVAELPPVLRVYEGCAQALAGTIEEATILKLHREKPQVSYLAYPAFDADPHPALSTVVIARLGQLRLTFRDFREAENPPILHRKEAFVSSGYPAYDRFRRLTEQEDRHDLLSSPTIGNRDGWERRLAESGFELRGHRLVRRPKP